MHKPTTRRNSEDASGFNAVQSGDKYVVVRQRKLARSYEIRPEQAEGCAVGNLVCRRRPTHKRHGIRKGDLAARLLKVDVRLESRHVGKVVDRGRGYLLAEHDLRNSRPYVHRAETAERRSWHKDSRAARQLRCVKRHGRSGAYRVYARAEDESSVVNAARQLERDVSSCKVERVGHVHRRIHYHVSSVVKHDLRAGSGAQNHGEGRDGQTLDSVHFVTSLSLKSPRRQRQGS